LIEFADKISDDVDEERRRVGNIIGDDEGIDTETFVIHLRCCQIRDRCAGDKHPERRGLQQRAPHSWYRFMLISSMSAAEL
jgi:hypothetical protein